MYRLHVQYFKIFLKSVKSAYFNEILHYISKSIKYLFVYKIFQNVKVILMLQ